MQGDWVGGVVFTTFKLPPLPLLEVAPLSTATAFTDFPESLERLGCQLLLLPPLLILVLVLDLALFLALFLLTPLPPLLLLRELLWHRPLPLPLSSASMLQESWSAPAMHLAVLKTGGFLPLPLLLLCHLLLMASHFSTYQPTWLHNWLLTLLFQCLHSTLIILMPLLFPLHL